MTREYSLEMDLQAVAGPEAVVLSFQKPFVGTADSCRTRAEGQGDRKRDDSSAAAAGQSSFAVGVLDC